MRRAIILTVCLSLLAVGLIGRATTSDSAADDKLADTAIAALTATYGRPSPVGAITADAVSGTVYLELAQTRIEQAGGDQVPSDEFAKQLANCIFASVPAITTVYVADTAHRRVATYSTASTGSTTNAVTPCLSRSVD
ncbi:MAG: hypothetical protein P4L93_07625 [Coriobacteriia bacterium]|nr:hypothetical protein [Coriobacteriia bacterium]